MLTVFRHVQFLYLFDIFIINKGIWNEKVFQIKTIQLTQSGSCRYYSIKNDGILFDKYALKAQCWHQYMYVLLVSS